MAIWVTSDHHFGHANIVPYCKRPFPSVLEMDEELIRLHNKTVNKDEVVYHLGDFSLHHNPIFYLPKLNGRFLFVKGNHDTYREFKHFPEAMIFHKWGVRIQMAHRHKDLMPGYDINLCGHIHEKWRTIDLEGIGKVVNVGVDVWNFRPVSLQWIVQKWKEIRND